MVTRLSWWRCAARSTVTVSCGVTLTPISATAPFTYTHPWAIQSSASRREHRPSSARRLFRRTAPSALAFALVWGLPGARGAGRGAGGAPAAPERTAAAGRVTGDGRAAAPGERAADGTVGGLVAAAGVTGGAATAGRRSTGREAGVGDAAGDAPAAGAPPSDDGAAEWAGGRELEEDIARIVNRGLAPDDRPRGNKSGKRGATVRQPHRHRQSLPLARLPGQKIIDRQRPGDVIALRFIARQCAQVFHDLGRLDPLGHHGQPQVVRQVDGRAHDHHIVLAHLHAHHKGFVDLEFIHRQALEVSQR